MRNRRTREPIHNNAVRELSPRVHPERHPALAGRELPRADRLGEFLYELADAVPPTGLEELVDEDFVEDYLPIERVEPGRLWFEGGIGPLEVPEEASELAEVGWEVNVVLARTRAGWRLLEVGCVYP